MKKLLISNLVYGDVYPGIFVDEHLRSLLDPTNIPKWKDRLGYMLYTDAETHEWLRAQPMFQALKTQIPVRVIYMDFAPGANKYDLRYGALAAMLKQSIDFGLEKDCYLSTIVADLVFAQGFFDKIFQHLDAGFDSVFMHPMRTAYESMQLPENLGQFKFAAPAKALFEIGYANLHPLWNACHWNAAQFSRIPDTLLWNSGTGLLARTFSITPIAFTPYPSMRGMNRVIDVGVPPLCRKPHWCKDWTDAPVIGVEPLRAWYPPFFNGPSSVDYIRSKKNSPERLEFSLQKLYYPDEQTVNLQSVQWCESNAVVNELNGIGAT